VGSLLTLRAALKAAMAAAMPARVITRDLRDFAEREEADLLAGVVTLVGAGEKDYVDLLGGAYDQGTVPFTVVGQVKIGEGTSPSAVEDAEDALMEEIKAFVINPGSDLLGGIRLLGWRQSGQLEHPYGWIGCDIEVLT
jgi:hypothetical protein